MNTTRLTAAERKQWGTRAPSLTSWRRATVQLGEPALGTLDERLGIIIRRLGGTTGPIRLTDQERQLRLDAEVSS